MVSNIWAPVNPIIQTLKKPKKIPRGLQKAGNIAKGTTDPGLDLDHIKKLQNFWSNFSLVKLIRPKI